MRFYRATRFLFPRNYVLRLFFVCFLGTHVPLLSFIGWELVTGRALWMQTIVLLVATLLGTAATIAALAGLLRPLRVATEALAMYEDNQTLPDLPEGSGDLIGQLLSSIRTVTRSTSWVIDELDQAANRDALTGLSNRRGLQASGEALLRRRGTFSVALIDLDAFKSINDRFGHEEGDHVLRMVANVLRTGVRKQDVVARWGGEEFTILFASEELEEAATMLRRIQVEVAKVPYRGAEVTPLTFSAGVTALRPEEITLDAALARADRALYSAKESGRNRVEIAQTA